MPAPKPNSKGNGAAQKSATVDLRGYLRRFEGRVGVFKQGVLIKLFASVIRDTPVLTGRLRANWQFATSLDGLPPATDETDPAGVRTTNKINEGVLKFVDGKDGVYYMGNSLPYVTPIEYLGWSQKSPAGMVRKNIRRISQILKLEARKRQ